MSTGKSRFCVYHRSGFSCNLHHLLYFDIRNGTLCEVFKEYTNESGNE